jgi:hypothetical protein
VNGNITADHGWGIGATTTDFTWHVCSFPCWCGNSYVQPSTTVWYSAPRHDHDYRQVKGERLLFCRSCGETKKIEAPR